MADGLSAAGLGGPHQRLSWLRASVLGAHDGIVATSGLVIGVAAAGASHLVLLTSGLVGVMAGAVSMAVGEFVSVSTQRDVALVPAAWARARRPPGADGRGDPAAGTAEALAPLDGGRLFNPWQAAAASMASYVCGAFLPLLMVVFVTGRPRILAVVLAASLALAVTGLVSARLGHVRFGNAVVRNVATGLIAMAITFGVGSFVGRAIG